MPGQISLPALVQRIVADTSQFSKGLNTAQSQMARFGQGMSKIGANMTKFVTLPLVGFGAFAVKAFAEAEKVQAVTAQLIKTTGGAAGVTAEHIANLSSEMQRLTAVSDETVGAAANMLLSFKNVRNVGEGTNAVFDRTVRAARDISVVMDTDMRSAMMQLAKAVEDPARGMTMLRRAGVTFTKDQEQVIKSLAESGQLLEAQKILLDAVEGQVGGAGEAYGKTLAGGLERAKNAFGDFMERIGAAIAPFLSFVTKAFESFVALLQVIPAPVLGIGVAFAGVAAAAGPVLWIVGKLMTSYALMVGQTLPALAAGLIRLSGGHTLAAIAARQHAMSANGLVATLRAVAVSARIAGTAIVQQIRAVASAHPIMAAITVVLLVLTAAIAAVVKAFNWAAQNVKPFSDALAKLRDIWNTHVMPVFRMIWKVISTAVVPILDRLKDVVARVFTSIAEWIERNQDNIKRWVTAAVTAFLLFVKIVKDVVGPIVISVVSSIITVFVDLLQIMFNLAKMAVNMGKVFGALMAGDFEAAGKAAGDVIGNLEDIAHAAKSALVDVPRKAAEAQAQAAEALADFVAGNVIEDTAKEVQMEIDRAIKDQERRAGEAAPPEPEEGEEPGIDESIFEPIGAEAGEAVSDAIVGAAPVIGDEIATALGREPMTVDVAADEVRGRGTFIDPNAKLDSAATKLDSAATKLEAVARAQSGRALTINGLVVREPPEAILEWFHSIEAAAVRV